VAITLPGVHLQQAPLLLLGTPPAAIRNRDGMMQLRGIETYESFAIIPHDSPSLLEALPGLSG
jgi:hypothetical protein